MIMILYALSSISLCHGMNFRQLQVALLSIFVGDKTIKFVFDVVKAGLMSVSGDSVLEASHVLS